MRAVLRLLFMDEIEKLFIDFLLTLFVIYIELLRFFWWILSLRRFLNLLLLLRAFIIICRGLFLNILGLFIISLNVLTLCWDLHNTILLLERSRLLSTLAHYLGKSLTWDKFTAIHLVRRPVCKRCSLFFLLCCINFKPIADSQYLMWAHAGLLWYILSHWQRVALYHFAEITSVEAFLSEYLSILR